MLSTLERDSTEEALFASAFTVLIGFLDDLDQALAAEVIQPNGELGQRIKKAAQGAFGTHLYALLRVRAPGGSA